MAEERALLVGDFINAEHFEVCRQVFFALSPSVVHEDSAGIVTESTGAVEECNFFHGGVVK